MQVVMAQPQQQLLHIIFSPQALLTLFLCFIFLLLLRYYNKQPDKGRRLPPSPPGRFPIIGHLHLVSPESPHASLTELSRKHAGPDGLLLLDLGQAHTLVVFSPRAAEAVLRAHDHASRPPSAVADVLFSGASDVAFAPYSEYWRQARRLVATHLLSAGKVSALAGARGEEVALVLAKVRQAAACAGAGAGQAVDLTELLGAYANDAVCRAVSDRFFREERRNELFWELIAGNAAVLAGFSIEDFFPGLAKLRLLRRLMLAKTIGLKKRWYELLDKIIDDHSAKLSSSSSQKQHDRHDDEQEDQERLCRCSPLSPARVQSHQRQHQGHLDRHVCSGHTPVIRRHGVRHGGADAKATSHGQAPGRGEEQDAQGPAGSEGGRPEIHRSSSCPRSSTARPTSRTRLCRCSPC